MKRPRLNAMLRQLTGAGGGGFVELLLAQIDSTSEAARLARLMSEGGGDERDLARIQGLERQGDLYREKILDALSVTLVTPIDREDLFRVSRTVDDILDNLRDFAIERLLYDLAPGLTFTPLLDAVLNALSELRLTILCLRENPGAVTAVAGRTKSAGNQVRRIFQTAVAELFATPDVHIEILKARELLRRLDVVGIRLREAADVLFDASIKRSF